jgi:hypothetical protein
VTLRRPREDCRTDVRLRLVAVEPAQQRRIAEPALYDRLARVTQLGRQPHREREVDEARLAREHVAGLCSVTCDHERRATVARNRAPCHRGYRSREDLRLDE